MIAKLHLQTAMSNGITFLKECYCTTPFKVADITEDKKSSTLKLMLMSSSPGILDADDYEININVAAACSMELHTQAYQRLFTMSGQALQQTTFNIGEYASLRFIQQPTVPHAASNFTSRNKIFLSDTSSLLIGEILTCGRKLNGEIFAFSKYHSVTEIFINDELIIKENLLLQPSSININAIGQLQGYTHQGSLIYLNKNADIKKLIPILTALLSTQKEISAGITTAPANGFMVRILGMKAAQLYDCFQLIAGCLPNSNCVQSATYAI